MTQISKKLWTIEYHNPDENNIDTYNDGDYTIRDAEGNVLINNKPYYSDAPEKIEDAAHIVKCVNEYDGLIEMVRELSDFIGVVTATSNIPTHIEVTLSDLEDKAQALVKRLEE